MEVVEVLIKAGADVDAVNNDWMTALTRAAGNGDTEVVEMLVKAGAPVDSIDKDDRIAPTHC